MKKETGYELICFRFYYADAETLLNDFKTHCGDDDLGEESMVEANNKLYRITRLWRKIDPEMSTFPVNIPYSL